MAVTTRKYGGIGADERRARRRAQLIEAGLEVLGREGIEGTTMTGVCAQAGLTERYFYESFRDLDDLLLAVVDENINQLGAAVLIAVSEAPPDLYARSHAAAGTLIRYLTDDPRRARAYVEAIGSAALQQRRAQAVGVFAAVLAEQMRELRDLNGERHRARLEVATIVLIGGVSEAVARWIAGGIDLSREELIDECAQLCVGTADALVG